MNIWGKTTYPGSHYMHRWLIKDYKPPSKLLPLPFESFYTLNSIQALNGLVFAKSMATETKGPARQEDR